METMGESVTALAIREGSVEEVMFFRPGSIFRWQQEQSYDKEGASCPLQRQLLLPASPCSSGHVLCALKNTHTGLSLARTARAPHTLRTSVLSTVASHWKAQGRLVLSGSSGHSSPSVPCDSQNRSLSGSREPFGLLILPITPLRGCHFTHARTQPGGYIFCGGTAGSSLRNGSKDWPSR